MSYCRFSSDNFKSDVYVYESVDDCFYTHVAGNRLILPPFPEIRSRFAHYHVPRLLGFKYDIENKKFEARNKFCKFLLNVWFFITGTVSRLHLWTVRIMPRKSIDLPFAGETIVDPSAEECLQTLETLQEMGYHVPSYAIENLKRSILKKNE